MAGKYICRGCMNSARDSLVHPLFPPMCVVLFSLMLPKIWNSVVGKNLAMQNLWKSVVALMQINLSHNFQLYFPDSYTELLNTLRMYAVESVKTMQQLQNT